MSEHLLAWLIFWPLVAGALLFVLPKSWARTWALLAALGEFGLAIALAGNLQPTPSWQFTERWSWILPLGITFHLASDGISGFLVMTTAALTPLAILATVVAPAGTPGTNHARREFGRAFFFWILAFAGSMIGALLTLDLLVFYVFWELMLLPAFFLVGIWGGEQRVPATVKFALMTLVGSLTMLLAILYIGVRIHDTTGAWSFGYEQALGLSFSRKEEIWLFFAFMAAFAVKIPLFPLHPWLPGAYTAAPTAAVLLMSAVMAKLGVYGLLRFAIPMFPNAAFGFGGLFMALATIGILYGALLALGQGDIKRLIAYSSFSHLGWITLGILAFNLVGVTGAVYQMLSHAVATGALFLLVGMLWERAQSTDIKQFSGLATVAPYLATCFVIVSLASLGLPGLNGFIGEFMILLGAWGRSPWAAGFGAVGVVLGAAYLLFLLQRTMFGPVKLHEEAPGQSAKRPAFADLSWREAIVVLPLVSLTVIMGVWPAPFLERIEPAVRQLLLIVEARRTAMPDSFIAVNNGQPSRRLWDEAHQGSYVWITYR
ncbi:MAG: NADH-quinone oxidoreductase subunit M [Cyanobacteria bacterium NC_groundwater_1444_Ag_S-0.65um_54_12]|nr:NADH-quinone oxidoreductase subunit M [Cyanobacteria bacterium NC_groundwater_1444_Ag_S-0.65um_54_12]